MADKELVRESDLRSVGFFSELVEKSSAAVLVASASGAVRYSNAAGRSLLEYDGDGSYNVYDAVDPADLPFVTDVIVPAVKRVGRWGGPLRLVRRSSKSALFARIDVFELHDVADAIAFVVRDVTEEHRADTQLQTLVELGAALSHTETEADILEAITRIVVRTYATFCVAELFARETQDPHAASVAHHVDGAKQKALSAVTTFLSPRSGGPATGPVARIVADGSSTLVAGVDEDWIAAHDVGPSAGTLAALEPASMMIVPFVIRGDVIGALTMGLGAERHARIDLPRHYDAEDLFFSEEIGRRTGAAIDIVRSHNRQRTIALKFQADALPRQLPKNSHVVISADYRPGTAELTVGGDWYDAFFLPDGRLVLTIGDVVGHGLDAALSMAKLRQAMKAAATVLPDPQTMLSVADITLQTDCAAAFATALTVIYSPATDELHCANAGHVAALLRSADGSVHTIGGRGLMLGIDANVERRSIATSVQRPFSLLLYTDGLVEVARELEKEERDLTRIFATFDYQIYAEPAHALVDALLMGRHSRDDIAALFVHVR